MKKFIFVLAFAMVFSGMGTGVVSAAGVTCDHPNHAIWSEDSATKVGCISSHDWDASLSAQVNQNNPNDFVRVYRGQTVMTTYGYASTCPSWFPDNMNCVIKKSLFVSFI